MDKPVLWLPALCGLFAGAPAGAAADPPPAEPSHESAEQPGEANGESELAGELEHGYALLYELVSSLRHANKLFLVKFEPDDVQAFTDDMSSIMSDIREKLETLAETGSGMDLEDPGTPRFEHETRKAMGRARIESFAPIVGKTGTDFERTLLLTQSGGLNQMRYLTEVLAEAETDADRQRFLSEASQKFDALYRRVTQLLNEQYFRNP